MPDTTTARVDTHPFIKSVHGVRYHVKMLIAPSPSTRGMSGSSWNISNFRHSQACRSETHKSSPHSRPPTSAFETSWKPVPADVKIQIEDPDGNPIELFEPAR